jgi:hypothetical protein
LLADLGVIPKLSTLFGSGRARLARLRLIDAITVEVDAADADLRGRVRWRQAGAAADPPGSARDGRHRGG